MQTMYERTAERLASYHDFNPEMIDRIARVAEAQSHDENFGAFFERIGLPTVESFNARFGEAPLQVLDYRPKEHDPDDALVLHLPMANPLDDNQRYQVATVIAAHPNKRIIVAGNPSGGSWDSGRLNRDERTQLITTNIQPLATALDRYLTREKIHHADQAGESYGTLKAAALARYGQRAMSHLIMIEPIIGERGLLTLGLQFKKTDKALHTYTRAPGLEQFTAARKANSIKGAAYILGLAQPSNVAIIRALARGDVLDDVKAVLDEQQEATAHFAWGTETEFGTDTVMPELAGGLFFATGGRVRTTRLSGQKHALGNDIHLKTALISDALAA